MTQVTAYKAFDGTLFEHEVDMTKHNTGSELKADLKELAESAMVYAPYKDDWNCTAFSEPQELELALAHLIGKHSATLKHVLTLAEKLKALEVT